MEATIVIQLYRIFWKRMSFYLERHVFLIWLNMLMLRCNVFGKGEIDGGIRIFKAGF